MRRLLPALAVASLIPLAVFVLGYVGGISVGVQDVRPAGAPPVYWDVDIAIEEGRVRCFRTTATAMPTMTGWPIVAPVRPGRHIRWNVRFDPKWDLKRATWDGDAHVLVNKPPVLTYIYAVPIWCFAWPFLIAPLLWLRQRRRRRPDQAGFAVVT